MRNRLSFAVALLLLAMPARAASPPPTLRIPSLPDRTVAPESLLGADRSDARLEDTEGNVTVYHGLPLLAVLEKGGLETKSMPSQRKLAPGIVVVKARDGYTVVFSMGELLMHRSDPRAYLVSETAEGPLSERDGPVRLIVYGDRSRSAYGLALIEVRYLSENPPKK